MKLHLDQLDTNPFADPLRQRCLAHLVLPNHSEEAKEVEGHIKTSLDWFAFVNPNPAVIEPTLSRLTELSFLFTDERNEELQLTSGPPTILNCIIEEMESVDRFSLTLNPSLSSRHFPTNTDTNFRVTYGSPIATEANWEAVSYTHLTLPTIYSV